MAEVTVGFGLRFIQSLAAAAPTILVGLFVAGVFERLLGYEGIRRFFGGKGMRALLTAWILGMLLPVCSLGVIPILRVLRRAGLSGGTILAFALSAPLFNPLSILYGLTLSRPVVVFAFAGCSLAIVTVVGLIWDKLFPGSESAAAPAAVVPPGAKRMLSVAVFALRELTGPTLGLVLLGLAGSALLAAALPHGTLQRSMNGDNLWAPLTMTAVSIPAYATPMLAMSQIGSMFQHANSSGAALVLLVFGTGINLGILGWMSAAYGWRKSLVWLSLMTVVVLGLAYAVDRPLYPTDVDPADHSHAFDIYTSPFTQHGGDVWTDARIRLGHSVNLLEWRVLAILAGMLAMALVLRWTDPRRRVEAWLEANPSPDRLRLDRAVPAPVLGVVALVVLLVLSVVGCFIYYPPADEIFDELAAVRAEAFFSATHGHTRQTDHYIGQWDDWTRKLEVGTFLRKRRLTEYEHIKARILREKLELLRHEVEDGDQAAVKIMVRQVNTAHDRLRQAFLPMSVDRKNSKNQSQAALGLGYPQP